MAAENVADGRPVRGLVIRFNEAAAHGRGKHPRAGPPLEAGGRFNEAAAHGRGKPAL